MAVESGTRVDEDARRLALAASPTPCEHD